MRLCCAVLIAAVTVNCLVTAINGKTATNTVIEPSNMLLPPLEDKPQDAVKTTKTPATTTTRKPTTTTRAPTTTTTAEPVNNVVVPELSIEALLPPLFEAKIEKAEDKHKQSGETTTKSTTTNTVTTTATQTTTTSYTQKPTELSKPTKKPSKDVVKQYTKQSVSNKHVAGDAGKTKPIPQHVISNIEKRITNQVISKVAQKKAKNTISTAASGSTVNYSLSGFDIYLGSTTPRPPKYGLPTITPFPRRLG
ncbi:uncharacterized protein [Musca autumnalis]|uniref:uncharacterized protein n=1 Tax=Musca autumnalis TaxID=221902 RepID=UPI003CF89807